jgi:predicted nucleotidyltransferase
VIPKTKKERILSNLRDYFNKKREVSMAFLFGSWAKNQEGAESDMDIAVYFKPKLNALEWQDADAYYETESKIWADIENIVEMEVDLLVLNRAHATVADSALRGIPIVIKDRNLHMNFFLRITSEAIDFREWVDGYWRLKEKRKYAFAAGRH